jgi:error-prone DNA polymerase
MPPERRPLQDILTCVREKCTIPEAGYRLEANAERHLKPPHEMARLFGRWPGAVERTVRDRADMPVLARRARSYQYLPRTSGAAGKTPAAASRGAVRGCGQRWRDSRRSQAKVEAICCEEFVAHANA